MILTNINIQNYGLIKRCKSDISTPSGVVLFYGPGGSGKTTLANAIVETISDNSIIIENEKHNFFFHDINEEKIVQEVLINCLDGNREVTYSRECTYKRLTDGKYCLQEKERTINPPAGNKDEFEEYLWNFLLVCNEDSFRKICKNKYKDEFPSVFDLTDSCDVIKHCVLLKDRMLSDLRLLPSQVGCEDIKKLIEYKNKDDSCFKLEIAYLEAIQNKLEEIIDERKAEEKNLVEHQFWTIIDKLSKKSKWWHQFTMNDILTNRACLSQSQHIEGYIAFVLAYRDYMYEKYDVSHAPIVIDHLLSLCDQETLDQIVEYLSNREEQIFVFAHPCMQPSSVQETFNISRISDFESVVEKVN